MKEFVKVVLLSPVVIAAIVAVFHRLVREWELAGQFASIFSLALTFGIWFPFFLMPYLKRKSSKL
jgi:hypothetical protein